jgi:hypothetical protein
MAGLQPNEYTLKGGGITIAYVTNGFLGHPTLSYKDHHQALHFKGPEIRVLPTEIGALVSVTLNMTIDAGSTSFSFLIPVIELADRNAEQKFETVGVRTDHKTALVLPATGLRESYEIHKLEGIARSVIVPLGAAQAAGAS